jgi:hypothetical protein
LIPFLLEILGQAPFQGRHRLGQWSSGFIHYLRRDLGHQIADQALQQLASHKEKIHAELGVELKWNPYPEKRDKIVLLDRSADLPNRERWPEYLDWMVNSVVGFHKAFRDRVRNLNLTGSSPPAQQE